MNDGGDVRVFAIDLAMDVAFGVEPAAVGRNRLAVEAVFQDIVGGDRAGRDIARQQKAIGALVMPHADMAECIDDALVEQNMIGGDEVIDQVLIGGPRLAPRAGRRLEGLRRGGVIA